MNGTPSLPLLSRKKEREGGEACQMTASALSLLSAEGEPSFLTDFTQDFSFPGREAL